MKINNMQDGILLHSAQADLFASRYNQLSDPYIDCFSYSRYRLQALLHEYLPTDGSRYKILDVGCGTGNYIKYLEARKFDVTGVDASTEMLQHARRLNPNCEIVQSDVCNLPFPDSSYDFAICIEVLRYLSNPIHCIQQIARILRPGGVCLATACPIFNLNGYWLTNRIAGLFTVNNLVSYQQSFVTSAALSNYFSDSDFSRLRIHGVYFGPVNWVERLAPKLVSRFLRGWDRIDRLVADTHLFDEFANMFFICAVRKAR